MDAMLDHTSVLTLSYRFFGCPMPPHPSLLPRQGHEQESQKHMRFKPASMRNTHDYSASDPVREQGARFGNAGIFTQVLDHGVTEGAEAGIITQR